MADLARHEFDVRVIEFHLRRQSVTYEEFNGYLAEIPDSAEHSEETVTRFTNSYEQRHLTGAKED